MGFFSFIGGLFGARSQRKESKRQRNFEREMTAQERKWFLQDRSYDERFNKKQLTDDRRYAEGLLSDERDYQKGVTRDDRAYGISRLKDDRAYLDAKRNQDIAQYSKDRDFMQRRSDRLAEQTAASRGVNFTKMRDDAIAAGYSPMTALNMAHAYSTEVNYNTQGGVYSPGAAYTASGPGYNGSGGGGGGGGGGVAPMGTGTPSASLAAGGFQAGGRGYSSSGGPDLISAGSFLGEAFERGLDSYFNTPEQSDPLADALRNIEESENVSLNVQKSQIPRGGFGYDLTKQRPFEPSMTVGIPPLRDQNKQLAPAKPAVADPAKPSPSDDSVTPSVKPLKVLGKDFKPQSGTSDASAFEDRYGEIAGEVAGLTALGTDLLKPVYDLRGKLKDYSNRKKAEQAKAQGKGVYKINGKWYVQDDAVPVSRKARDYMSTGKTGSQMLRLPSWMRSMR